MQPEVSGTDQLTDARAERLLKLLSDYTQLIREIEETRTYYGLPPTSWQLSALKAMESKLYHNPSDFKEIPPWLDPMS